MEFKPPYDPLAEALALQKTDPDFLARNMEGRLGATIGLGGELEYLLRALAQVPGMARGGGFREPKTKLPRTDEGIKLIGGDPEDPATTLGSFTDLTGGLGKVLGAASMIPIVGKTLKASDLAGDFKQVKKTGAFVGAPPGVKSEEDIAKLVSDYADRVEEALDAGVDPDYFYRTGEKALQSISPNADIADKAARINAITSSEAPVRTNFGWAGKAFEQSATGRPVHTGKYPNTMSPQITDVLEGGRPKLGEKRELYGGGLSGETRRTLPPESRKAPNDRWEIRGFGYPTDTAGPAQHRFMHEVRRLATDEVNKRRGTSLDPLNTQELNWATVRANEMDIPIPKSAQDTIQDSIDYYTLQHSWETVPGKTSGHLPDADLGRLDEGVSDVLLSDDRDKLIDAMSGNQSFQQPPLRGPGVFEGQVVPYGHQSGSQVFHAGGKLDPASRERVEGTEMVRGLMLGQDAIAGSLPLPSKLKTVPQYGGALQYKTDVPITMDQTQDLVQALASVHGQDAIGVVPTRKGVNVLSTGAKGLQNQGPEIQQILGATEPGTIADFRGTGFYEEIPWSEGRATETVLESLGPEMLKHADSPATRQIAGDLASLYQRLEAAGETPNAKLVDVLKAWSTGGIPAVQKMVKQGLAPAAALAVLSQYGEPGPRSESGQVREN